MRRHRRLLLLLAGLLVLGACATQRHLRSSALDFLYPKGTAAAAATDVHLALPVRVGIAFAPEEFRSGTFTENQKQELLGRIAAAFREHEGLESVEVVPALYLSPNGGFENLDRLAGAFGIDLVVLVSYDQFQFSETGTSSWTYWTLLGAYFVKGEKNETRTLLNAVVYDIPSRTMLFQTSGESGVTGRSTPVEVEKALRKGSDKGFDEATDDLIVNLNLALAAFETQAATGTVRGPGTSAISVTRAGAAGPDAGGGAGAIGGSELLGAALLVALAYVGRRRGSAWLS